MQIKNICNVLRYEINVSQDVTLCSALIILYSGTNEDVINHYVMKMILLLARQWAIGIEQGRLISEVRIISLNINN